MTSKDFDKIKEVCNKLIEIGFIPNDENKEKYVNEYYKLLSDLYDNKHINENIYSELREKFADAILAEEIKSFKSGVYFIIKAKTEMGEKLDAILKDFDL